MFIVRDEERRLQGALADLEGVPEIVVCDTGSTDATLDIARAAGARTCAFQWCDDFAAARTYAESQASHDWIVRFDADERLRVAGAHRGGEWLARAIASGAAAGADRVFVRRRYSPHNLHWFPRCHRRSAYRWVHPVHELLEARSPRPGQNFAADGAVVEHDREARPRPYRMILESAVAKKPDDPHLLYYLGTTCFEEGDNDAAELWLTRYLAGPPGYRYHRSEAFLMRGRCRAARRDVALAFDDFEAASALGPRAEPLVFAAQLAVETRDHEAAERYVRRGSQIPMPPERQPFGGWDHPYLLDRSAYEPSTWAALCEDLRLRSARE